MNTKSNITGKMYEPSECVFIVNAKQSYKYIKNNAELLDLLCGKDDRLIFVFLKQETQVLYDKWCKREL